MNFDVVQKTCRPLCREHLGGVPVAPVNAGKREGGKVVRTGLLGV